MTTSDLKADTLQLVTSYPALDDEEVADQIGIPAFAASVLLRELEAEGKIFRA